MNVVRVIVALAVGFLGAFAQPTRPDIFWQTGVPNICMEMEVNSSGTRLAAVGWSGIVHIYDQTKLIRTLQGPILPGGSPRVGKILFQPNSDLLAVSDNNGEVRFWNVETGALLSEMPGRVFGYAPDGSQLLLRTSNPRVIEVRRTSDFGLIRSYTFATDVLASAFNRGGTDFWVALQQNVYKFDAETGVQSPVFAFRDNVRSIQFSFDDSKMITSAPQGFGIFNVETGAQIGFIPAIQQYSDGLALHPDGDRLVVVGDNQSTRTYNLHTLAPLSSVTYPIVSIPRAAAENPAGQNVYVMTDVGIGKIGSTNQITDHLIMEYSSFGTRPTDVLTLSRNRRLTRSLSNGAIIQNVPNGTQGRLFVTKRNVGDYLLMAASRTDGFFATSSSPHLYIGQVVGSDQLVRFLPNESEFIFPQGNSANVRRFSDGALLRSFFLPQGYYQLSVSPDGQLLALSVGEQAQILDINSGQLVRTLASGLYPNGLFTRFSRDGTKVVVGGRKATLQLFDVATGTLSQIWELDSNADIGEFSANGKVFGAASSLGEIKFYSGETGQLLLSYDEEVGNADASGVMQFGFSIDDSRILYSIADGGVKVARNPFAPLAGIITFSDVLNPDAGVRSVSYEIVSPTGETVGSGMTDVVGNQLKIDHATPILEGTYALYVQGSTFLRKRVTFTKNTVRSTSMVLRNGDVDGNNIIDIADYILLAGAFGSEPNEPNWAVNADLNEDLIVDIADYVILSQNFSEVGA